MNQTRWSHGSQLKLNTVKITPSNEVKALIKRERIRLTNNSSVRVNTPLDALLAYADVAEQAAVDLCETGDPEWAIAVLIWMSGHIRAWVD
ncbi:MAG: hypothetical protein KZQ95_01900 [Candidatus Thiodiazotropha sp. (ex Epidulcina cf. delphinae)]|nr:hypothetical protein [Candidatus Thiodiazotropha sp. (ex Epidulcina cf. delphinae)]